jgi:hypothetical protein
MDFIIFSASEPVSADCVRVGTGGPSASSAAALDDIVPVIAAAIEMMLPPKLR